MKHMGKRTAFIAAVLLAATLGADRSYAAAVAIVDAWFRALPAGLPAGGYFTLHNGAATPITLVAAGSPACGMLMLHKSEQMSGVSSMSDVPRIDVPAGGTLQFAPGGYHLMCMSPSTLLKPGTAVPVTLDFADGSKITAPFLVRTATGK
jgi:periplasmic copper chaperone A